MAMAIRIRLWLDGKTGAGGGKSPSFMLDSIDCFAECLQTGGPALIDLGIVPISVCATGNRAT